MHIYCSDRTLCVTFISAIWDGWAFMSFQFALICTLQLQCAQWWVWVTRLDRLRVPDIRWVAISKDIVSWVPFCPINGSSPAAYIATFVIVLLLANACIYSMFLNYMFIWSHKTLWVSRINIAHNYCLLLGPGTVLLFSHVQMPTM